VPQADKKIRKLLVICGPTATGKTGLGLFLAKKFKGELVSADSRQVYKDMDIGTGKDIPKNFKFQTSDLKLKGVEVGFYTDGNIRLWGYDLVKPTEEFSVAWYIKIAREVIKDMWARKKLPILVGGTGLYIQGVIDGIKTASVPKNKELRESLINKPPDELFEHLAQIDPIKAGSMNVSDRKNPRRLIRAIEIAQWQLEEGKRKQKAKEEKFISKNSLLFVGLTAKRKFLSEKIKKRVEARVKAGIEKEIQKLLKSKVTWEDQAMDSLGYKQWKSYFEGRKKKSEIIKDWEKEESRYAKRQMVWFKKDKRINWFDVAKSNYRKDVEKLVKTWYNTK
jgi:tRNA dimethylallyltransferase